MALAPEKLMATGTSYVGDQVPVEATLTRYGPPLVDELSNAAMEGKLPNLFAHDCGFALQQAFAARYANPG